MTEFEISDDADQQFATLINNQRVTVRLRYNAVSLRWYLNLSIDDLPVLQGRKIVTGVDLLAPFNFGLGLLFAAPVVGDAVPGRAELPGGFVKMYSASEAEVEAALA